MNPIQWFVNRGRDESMANFTGVRWVHYATFIALGTSVLYFTLELDKAFSSKVRRVASRVT